MSLLAPTSTPCVGSCSNSNRGRAISHFASSAFCWLPPENVEVTACASGGRISNLADGFARERHELVAVKDTAPVVLVFDEHDDVLPQGKLFAQAKQLAVRGDEGDALPHAALGTERGDSNVLLPEPERAAFGLACAEQQVRQVLGA